MNCVNCGSRVTDKGCLCTPVGVDTDLLRKIERSNDDWINAQEEIAELKAELKEGFEQSISIIHDLNAENILLKERLAPIFEVWGRWKDLQRNRTSYPTIEETHQALYDFGKAIEKSMTGYNP
ncbi:MAG TPA: hypothetical protein ACFYD4_16850 [Candidatus Wunengus sp. YC61]|uniref:hypothetical protein n=1 Tax=Candidatus Wunengus sp. YC61 TaxID=3367698 RepID=UPI00402A3752